MRRFALALLFLLSVLGTVLPAAPAQAAGYYGNPFPYGQCTWWAARERPDLLGSVWGNAADWAAEARWSGRTVNAVPSVGAVAVFPAWSFGAWGLGHVAYVVAVSGPWVEVSEMDWLPWGAGTVDQRWAYAGWGMQFIH